MPLGPSIDINGRSELEINTPREVSKNFPKTTGSEIGGQGQEGNCEGSKLEKKKENSQIDQSTKIMWKRFNGLSLLGHKYIKKSFGLRIHPILAQKMS